MKIIILCFILTFHLIFCSDCDRSTPILIGNVCKSTFCTEAQFKNGDCQIKNEIIKTQWFTNIILIGEENSRFINFANFSNGTMIIEVSSDPGNNKRTFFCLNPDGSYLFDEENNNYQFTITSSSINNKRHYSENFCVTITENGSPKQYIVSIANEEQYIELYDFENNHIYEAKSQEKFGKKIVSIRHSSTNILYNDVNYVIFLSWISLSENPVSHSFITKALFFGSKDIEQTDAISVVIEHPYDLIEQISSMTSCFVSESNLIWVMGFVQEGEGDISYYIILYNPDNIGVDLASYRFQSTPFYDRTFFKIVHLRGDIGVAFYFAYQDGTTLPYPFFIIKEYKNNELINYIGAIEKYQINFNSRIFNYDCLLNDLIRISEYKVAFSTMDLDKKIFYVAIFEIHGTTSLFMKLYEIDLFSLYNIKFFLDVREHLFEQYLAFGFNYCNSDKCKESTDTHYSAFLIFSYPNSTDASLNINQYLEENEGSSISNININLTNNIRIENNIFGYIFSSINIVDLVGCDIIIFKSNSNNKIITKSYNLSENEIFKISSISKEKESFNCSIYFRYIITEPSYSENKKYYVDILPEGAEYEDIYNTHKNEYLGRIGIYKITYEYIESIIPTTIQSKLQTTVITEKETEKKTENIPYTTQKINIEETEKATELITEKKINTYHTEELLTTQQLNKIETEQITEKITEKPMEKITEQIRESSTEKPTEKITDQITQQTSEKISETSITDMAEKITEQIKEEPTEKLTEKFDEMTQIVQNSQNIEKISTNLIPDKNSEEPIEKLTEKFDETTQIVRDTQNIEKISSNSIPDKNLETSNTIEKVEQSEIKENYTCSNEELLENKCSNTTIEIEQVKEIFNYFSSNIKSYDYNSDEMKIIKTENFILQITTLDSQDINTYPNVSVVEIGECEKRLRNIYNISESKSLIMVKSDSKINEDSPTNVMFELYHPDTKEKLNMSYCDDVEITIHVPNELENNTVDLYESLLESGYNLFDSNDPFYNDACSIYTSPNGTDMILTDRQNIIYSQAGNMTLCQSGCKFNSYNKTLKTVQCDCNIQSVSVESENNEKEDFKDSFLDTLLNSNFLILKCLKLVFSSRNIFSNKGRIIMSVVGVLFAGLIIIFLAKDRNNINEYFRTILADKMKENSNNTPDSIDKEISLIKERILFMIRGKSQIMDNNEKKYNPKINAEDKAKKNIKDINKQINIYQNSKNYKNNNYKPKENKINFGIKKIENKTNLGFKKIENKMNFDIKKIENKTNFGIKKTENKTNFGIKKIENKTNFGFKKPENTNTKYVINNNIIIIGNKHNNKNKNRNKHVPPKKNRIKINKDSFFSTARFKSNSEDFNRLQIEPQSKQNIKKPTQLGLIKEKDSKTHINEEIKETEIYYNLNDDELNSLEYEKALIYDKRNYFQYYWSLLKTNQLLLFTFFPSNDYNLLSLKLTLFILSISLELTINGFFFTDDTMHQIHEVHGKFDLLYQIPQILYSSIISTLINTVLHKLALSEDSFIKLKHIKNFEKAKKLSESIKRCLIIKFIIFIIISFILMLFCWYYISSFCAVYINTQSILFKDTIIGFLISMVFPFVLCLLPGICRIPALRAKNKDKKCWYKFSGCAEYIQI